MRRHSRPATSPAPGRPKSGETPTGGRLQYAAAEGLT
jgi:hypothetical protein